MHAPLLFHFHWSFFLKKKNVYIALFFKIQTLHNTHFSENIEHTYGFVQPWFTPPSETAANQGMCRKLWQMLEKVVKTPGGIFIAMKMQTCLNSLNKISILPMSKYGYCFL